MQMYFFIKIFVNFFIFTFMNKCLSTGLSGILLYTHRQEQKHHRFTFSSCQIIKLIKYLLE